MLPTIRDLVPIKAAIAPLAGTRRALLMKRGWAGEVRNVSLLVASTVNSEGFREILAICEGAKEDKSGWSAFLRHLVDRGLTGVQLIISDACRGLMESAASTCQRRDGSAAWCISTGK